MRTTQEPNGKLQTLAKVSLIVTACGVAVGMLGMMAGAFNWLNKLTGDIDRHENVLTEIREQSVRNLSDRIELARQTEENKEAFAKLREGLSNEVAIRKADGQSQEIELDSLSQMTNMQINEMHRLLSIAWPKEIGTFPFVQPIQPNVSNRKGKED